MIEDVLEELTGDARPGWRIIGEIVVFSQAISGVQVTPITEGSK